MLGFFDHTLPVGVPDDIDDTVAAPDAAADLDQVPGAVAAPETGADLGAGDVESSLADPDAAADRVTGVALAGTADLVPTRRCSRSPIVRSRRLDVVEPDVADGDVRWVPASNRCSVWSVARSA